jgi:hypothetical protein
MLINHSPRDGPLNGVAILSTKAISRGQEGLVRCSICYRLNSLLTMTNSRVKREDSSMKWVVGCLTKAA